MNLNRTQMTVVRAIAKKFTCPSQYQCRTFQNCTVGSGTAPSSSNRCFERAYLTVQVRPMSNDKKKHHNSFPENVWEKAEHTVNLAGEKLIRKAGEAVGFTQKVAHDAVEYGSEKVHDAGQFAAQKAEDAAVFTASKAGQAAGTSVKVASEKIEEAATVTANVANAAVHYGMDKVNTAATNAQQVGEIVKDFAKETVEHAVHDASAKVHKVNEKAHKVYEDTKETIKDDIKVAKEVIKTTSIFDAIKDFFDPKTHPTHKPKE